MQAQIGSYSIKCMKKEWHMTSEQRSICSFENKGEMLKSCKHGIKCYLPCWFWSTSCMLLPKIFKHSDVGLEILKQKIHHLLVPGVSVIQCRSTCFSYVCASLVISACRGMSLHLNRRCYYLIPRKGLWKDQNPPNQIHASCLDHWECHKPPASLLSNPALYKGQGRISWFEAWDKGKSCSTQLMTSQISAAIEGRGS